MLPASLSRIAALAFFLAAIAAPLVSACAPCTDVVSQQQADLEKKALADNSPCTQTQAIVDFRKRAQRVEYPVGKLKLPGWLYRPAGEGPFPAVIWNHGSEKNPLLQAELARFYTEHGFVFFLPIREGHGNAPGPYILDLQQKIFAAGINEKSLADAVQLQDRFNADVVAAVAWLKTQPFVDRDRIVMSGCSFGGIQTLLTAEKGLGIRAFIPFAPGACPGPTRPFSSDSSRPPKTPKAPVFLIQAKNDFSTGPSERLGPLLAQHGPPSGNKIYPPFGAAHERGHAAFACWTLGTTLWGPDVLHFIDAAFKAPQPAR